MKANMKKQLLTLILCVCFIIASCLSSIYITAHADHECHGEDCPICAQIKTAQKRLRELTNVTLMGIIALYYGFALIGILGRELFNSERSDPVARKIRMNN